MLSTRSTNRSAIRLLTVSMLAVAVLALGACGGGRPGLERLSPQELFERGERDFEAGRWDEAIRALERLLIFHPSHPRLEQAHFMLAESHFNKREFDSAAAEYTRLATAYPRSPFAEDARFKACQAYYNLSPRVQLDQQYTKAAVEHCEAMARVFPNSQHMPSVNEMLAELRNKLGEKIFIGGDFYFRRRAYDSAILYFERVVAEYGHTEIAPKALLRLVQAYDRIGYDDEALEARERLLREYPESDAAEEVRELRITSGA